MPSCKRTFVISMTVALAATPSASEPRARANPPEIWGANATVLSMALGPDALYLGGRFRYLGPSTGGAGAFDAATRQLRSEWPDVNGDVLAVAPDADGGWFLGGFFSAVGGEPRRNLAQIDADGQLTDWDPGANAPVTALAVAGSTVYVGGEFAEIGRVQHGALAALEASTGHATAWNPGVSLVQGPARIYAIEVSDGVIYVAGAFSRIAGQNQRHIAAFDAATGQLLPWDPDPDSAVYSIAARAGTVWAAGAFNHIGGQPRRKLAALDQSTGLATTWDPSASSVVRALAVSGDVVYAGGDFESMGGRAGRYLAAIDASTGAVLDWDAQASGVVSKLAVIDDFLYVGGEFERIGGREHLYVAELDAHTGVSTAWDWNAGDRVLAMRAHGGVVCVGGDFRSIGGVRRAGLAALDIITGEASAWDPACTADGELCIASVIYDDGLVYIGGEFAAVGGEPREDIAAIDASTGHATAWNPSAHNPQIFDYCCVYELAMGDGVVYAGGMFTQIGGQARQHLAALDKATGQATPWNPGADMFVDVLAVHGNTVYAGGPFAVIAGVARGRLAALDAGTGTATPWGASTDGIEQVGVIRPYRDTVYVGGEFTMLSGEPRPCIAALDTAMGRVLPWSPGFLGGSSGTGFVHDIVRVDNTVYIAGDFTSIGADLRRSIAALDATTAATRPWQHDVDGKVYRLAVGGGGVFAAGHFYAADHRAAGFARSFPAAGGTVGVAASLVQAEAGVDGVHIEWRLSGSRGALVQRRVEDSDWAEIGHFAADARGRLAIDDADVEAGVTYSYRLMLLDAGTLTATDPVIIAVAPIVSLRLGPPHPNPTRGLLTLDLDLPDDRGTPRIDVLDVRGRRVLSRDFPGLGRGRHKVRVDIDRRWPAGIYFVRLSRGSQLRTAKVLLAD